MPEKRKNNVAYRYPSYVKVKMIKEDKITLTGYLKLGIALIISTIALSIIFNYELFLNVNNAMECILVIKNSIKDYLYSSLFVSVLSFITYLVLIAFKKNK